MIVYDLRCAEGHVFEAWFRDSGAYEDQAAAGEVHCPLCDSCEVEKAVMAPNLGRGGSRDPARPDARAGRMRRALLELRSQVEKNCDYVGDRFPEEARRIHYGEADPRGIYGESTPEEASALKDEGIEVRRVPWLPRENS